MSTSWERSVNRPNPPYFTKRKGLNGVFDENLEQLFGERGSIVRIRARLVAHDATVVSDLQRVFERIELREKDARIQPVRPQQLSMVVVVGQTRGQYARALSRCHGENWV